MDRTLVQSSQTEREMRKCVTSSASRKPRDTTAHTTANAMKKRGASQRDAGGPVIVFWVVVVASDGCSPTDVVMRNLDQAARASASAFTSATASACAARLVSQRLCSV